VSRFLQLHLLTFYPPANLNRDDTGRPKTATVGGVPRLRISSQALKRAWRASEAMQAALKGHMGHRTQRFGTLIEQHLMTRGVPEAKAREAVLKVLPFFGKPKSDPDKALFTEQLAFISPEEMDAAYILAERLAGGETEAIKADDLLRRTDTAADIAMFGRMLADNPGFNREAAVQVAHAITTHRALVEDDYYTAVDDLKTAAEDAGAGFVGEQGFGSGVFYLYLCADLGLLLRNLGGDSPLAGTACGALAEAAATVAPSGKQNSFAARARAEYVLAERGDAQPRTLAGAFIPAVEDRGDVLAQSIGKLREFREQLATAYDDRPEHAEMNVRTGASGMAEVAAFCREAALSCPSS
jgi:CRISPR system Cascade subunit CasC